MTGMLRLGLGVCICCLTVLTSVLLCWFFFYAC